MPSEGSGRGFESRLVHHFLSLVQGNSVPALGTDDRKQHFPSIFDCYREPGKSLHACFSGFFSSL